MNTNAPYRISIDAHKRQVRILDRDGNTAYSHDCSFHFDWTIECKEATISSHAE